MSWDHGKAKALANQICNEAFKLPRWPLEILDIAKEIHAGLMELENCDQGVDKTLQYLTETLVNNTTDLKNRVLVIEEVANKLIEMYGWSVVYDERRQMNIVEGPCSDDEV
jgi:hypothetical protein